MLSLSLKNSRYAQYLYSLSAAFAAGSGGSYLYWPSPTLPKLTKDQTYAGITITPDEASWIASAPHLGVTFGSFLVAWLLDRIGRKNSLLVSSALLFIPWIAISFPLNGLMIILSRFVGGLGLSLAFTVVPIYIAEIADKDIRGKLSVINIFLSACAGLLILSTGPFISYVALNALCASFALVFACTFVFAPESPYYLVKINRFECAKKSLSRLMNPTASYKEIDTRLNEIKETVENDLKNAITLKELFRNRSYRKSLGIVVGIKSFVHLSGVDVITSYMQTIMELTDTGLSSKWISVIYGVIKLFSVFLSALLVDRLGRKPLLIISSFGTFISFTAIGVFFYLHDVAQINLTNINFLPPLLVLLYTVFMSIGILPLPFVMFGELFSTNVKDIGAFVFTFYGGGLAFIAVRVFNPLTEAWGIYSMFWIFGGCCLLGAFFAIFLVPETKNKSFAEVQRELNGKHI